MDAGPRNQVEPTPPRARRIVSLSAEVHWPSSKSAPADPSAAGCGQRVRVPLDVYERVRSQDDRFVVRPGHETPRSSAQWSGQTTTSSSTRSPPPNRTSRTTRAAPPRTKRAHGSLSTTAPAIGIQPRPAIAGVRGLGPTRPGPSHEPLRITSYPQHCRRGFSLPAPDAGRRAPELNGHAQPGASTRCPHRPRSASGFWPGPRIVKDW
jgi:hypothetical protein